MASKRRILLVALCSLLAGCAAPAEESARTGVEPSPPPSETAPARRLLSATWEWFETGSNASLRGVCGYDERVAWVSGTGGTVLRTIDGGKRWENVSVPGAESLDFRCIHVFYEDMAIVLSAGSPARAYMTGDGGKTWRLTFEDKRPEVFCNAMRFDLHEFGVAFGDPIEGDLQVMSSGDWASTWRRWQGERAPKALPGEVGFAASNSALALDGVYLYIGLGGETSLGRARVISLVPETGEWRYVQTPIASSASAGIFSLALLGRNCIVAVGGDYLQPERAVAHWAVSYDRGLTWVQPDGPGPRGYSSSVAAFPALGLTVAVAVGPYGLDVSTDAGNSWTAVDDTPWHALDTTPNGEAVWMSGPDGRAGVARIR